MYYITSNNHVLFRSKDYTKLQAKYAFMLTHAVHADTLSFTNIKPVTVKQQLNVTILSY